MTADRVAGRVLVAPDKFKGSATAAEAAGALAAGLRWSSPSLTVDACPVADGGEGTVDAAVEAGHTPVTVVATGPTGEPVTTRYARRGDEAVVEMADVSGLGRLPEDTTAPTTTTSRGTGEVIAAAVEAGCTRVVLGVGGSACTDGGAGLAQALGARLTDAAGSDIGPGGAALTGLAHVDVTALRRRLAGVEVVVASDVDNPLTGPGGAAAVYGPQKGATTDQVRTLDEGLHRLADAVAAATGEDRRDDPGAGAAGGVGFAAIALIGARLRPGIEVVLEMVGFAHRVVGASLVITGEGSLDEQTLSGKAPAGVASAARATGIPVVAVCGRNLLPPTALAEAGISRIHALSELEPDPARSMARATHLLEILGGRIAEDLTTTPPT